MKRVAGLARRLLGIVESRAAILLYHRVTAEPKDPYQLRVAPDCFEEHLQVIRKIAAPMRLSELVARLRTGRVPKAAVCVTFDDGYADNLEVAKPLLERYDVPATVFATTGAGGRSVELWWDELEGLLLSPGQLPARLEIQIAAERFEIELGGDAIYPESRAAQHVDFTLPDPDRCDRPSLPTRRHLALWRLYRAIRSLAVAERERVMAELHGWAGGERRVRDTHRCLSHEQLVRLDGGLVEVGAHTVNHPSLTDCPTQLEEIGDSKRTLEDRLGRSVTSFAYPHGHYGPSTIQAVRSLGFESACACGYRPVARGSDVYELPRIVAPRSGGAELERTLRASLLL